MNQLNKKTCVICSFLPLTDEYKKLWNKISELLDKQGFELLFLTSSEGVEGLKFPVISIPFSLKGFAENLGYTDLNKTYLDENDIHLIERDIFWNIDSADNYDQYLNGFYTCKYFYTELVKKIKPSLVFVWGNLLPQSIIFKEILENNNVPSFFLERGFFSGSLMIEELLSQKLNSFAEDKHNFRAIASYNNYERLKDFYFNNSTAKYPEYHDERLELILQQKIEEGFKIITFYGTHDSIFFPEDQIYARQISTIFKYTVEAARFISEEINKNPNLILVIKPHPADKNDYSLLESERVFVTKNFFNRRLIEISDLIIVGNSTIQYEVLISEKPIMLITSSSLYNYDAAYKPQSKNDFTSTLNEALAKSDFELKLDNSKIFFESLLKSHIYFYSEKSPGKNLEDFIDFIIANANKEVSKSTLFERLSEFEKNIFIHNQLCIHTDNKFRFVRTNHINNKFYPQITLLKEQLEKKLFDYYNYLSKDSDNELIIKAETLIAENSFSEARALLHKAVGIPNYKTDALNDLAYIDILEGKYEDAFNNIISVLQNNPNDVVAINNLNYLIENNFIETNTIKSSLMKIFNVPLQFKKISDFESYREYELKMRDEYLLRNEFENKLIPSDKDVFYYNAFCIVCDQMTTLKVDFWNSYQINGKKIPNWRERLVCPKCGLNNRMRLTFHVIKDMLPDFENSAVYITEQTTPLFKHLKKINPEIVGSEFIGKEIPSGSFNSAGIRNEDFTNLSFNDEEFDLLISLEVLEHIPDYNAALKESHRVLKKNGKFLFTVPFNRNSQSNLIRAKLNPDGSITHLLEPEYHGDPLNITQGCLCYYHFGWEILEDLKEAGYNNAYALLTYSKEYGYLGGEQIFFIAEKGAE